MRLLCCSSLILALIPFHSSAEAPDFSLANIDSELIKGNALRFDIGTEIGHIDNFLFQDKATSDTGFIKLDPEVFVQAQFTQSLFQLKANTAHYKFRDSSEDDHSNFEISAKYQFKFTPKQAIFVQGLLEHEYEYRGTGLSLGEADSLVKGDDKKRQQAELGYLYGNQDSVAKLEFSLDYGDHQYKSRREITHLLDSEQMGIKLGFDYLLSGKSYFTSLFSYQDIKLINNSALNRRQYSALFGLEWQSSAISHFEGLFGYQQASFDDEQLDSDGFKWQLTFDWSPLEHTLVTLHSGRNFENASKLEDSYRIVDSYLLGIRQSVSNRLNLTVNMGLNAEESIFVVRSEQEDFLNANIEFDYQWRDWLSFFIRYQFQQLDADIQSIQYERNSVSLGISASI